MPNALARETSPYLVQHKDNPVAWQPWGEAALALAGAENKLLLISVGYSACHWCHVMAHESFEDEEVAAVMNTHFVCIKVDREERPDIDQVYMDAVQLMRGQAGWPLNCFALPDGRPVYGLTYAPKDQWVELLQELANVYRNDPQKVIEYSQNLTSAVRELDKTLQSTKRAKYGKETVETIYTIWQQRIDTVEGGMGAAPKFPVPCNWQFQLAYSYYSKDTEAVRLLELTLDKMALGGIYDQLGGGFARYSTDALWRVPHFEKMLYDNGQLVSLYADAYRHTGKALYAHVVRQSLQFIGDKLTSPDGGFYSALDADSEGVEGKYYVWTQAELDQLLGRLAPLARLYYNTSDIGNWEADGQNILFRTLMDSEVPNNLGIPESQLTQELTQIKRILLAAREQRIPPGLDHKILTAWNGIMCKGYVDAFFALGDPTYLAAAECNAAFVERALAKPDGSLYRTLGKAQLNAFLEDYAHNLAALIALYQATFKTEYLTLARRRLDYVLLHFLDADSGLFFFNSDEDPALIARKRERYDSVMPSANAVMAHVLLTLGQYWDEPAYTTKAEQMLATVLQDLEKYPWSHAHWALLLLRFSYPQAEVAIVGVDALTQAAEFASHYTPDALLLGCTDDSAPLALLEQKFAPDRTLLYVCRAKACRLPAASVDQALRELQAGNREVGL